MILAGVILSAVMGMGVPQAFAAPNQRDCEQLVVQVKAMKRAQTSLLKSMVRKNDSLASTLDSYADDIAMRGQRIRRSDLISLRKSAEAFRMHSIRENDLVSKFEDSTSELLNDVEKCLVAANSVQSIRQSQR